MKDYMHLRRRRDWNKRNRNEWRRQKEEY